MVEPRDDRQSLGVSDDQGLGTRTLGTSAGSSRTRPAKVMSFAGVLGRKRVRSVHVIRFIEDRGQFADGVVFQFV